MEDDSPGDREDGRSFWGGLRGLLFGGDGEATLRDEIEEAIESREGETPRRRRPQPCRAADAAQHPPFRREERRRRRRAARRHLRRPRRPPASRRLVAAFAEAGHSRMPVFEESLDTVIGMIHVKDRVRGPGRRRRRRPTTSAP